MGPLPLMVVYSCYIYYVEAPLRGTKEMAQPPSAPPAFISLVAARAVQAFRAVDEDNDGTIDLVRHGLQLQSLRRTPATAAVPTENR